mgnify:CR=1 FL=1
MLLSRNLHVAAPRGAVASLYLLWVELKRGERSNITTRFASLRLTGRAQPVIWNNITEQVSPSHKGLTYHDGHAYNHSNGSSYVTRFTAVERRPTMDLTISQDVGSIVRRAKVSYSLKQDCNWPALRSLQVGQLMAAVDEIVVVGKPICSGRAKISVRAKVWCCSRETAT